MTYRRKCDLEETPIEGCMGGKGTVRMEELLLGPEEMWGEGGAYMRHTLNRGASTGTHTHENETGTMVIVRGKVLHTIDGWEQYPEEGDIITAQPGDIHEISQAGEEPLVLTAQILFA